MQQVRPVYAANQVTSLFSGIYLLEITSPLIGYTDKHKRQYVQFYSSDNVTTCWQIEVNEGYLVLPIYPDFYLMRIGEFKKFDIKQIS